jgi:PIN domain nuclease of toxin-antitoxin system
LKLLLDTHALLWALMDEGQLRPQTREAIADSSIPVFVSAASVWEIGIKLAFGKLKAPDDLLGIVAASSFQVLAITAAHAWAAGALPRHHDDPFDRMLIAQAKTEGLTLVSRDEHFKHYEVLWIIA